MILQLFPTASVLPHVVELMLKSPLATIDAIFNVAEPVFDMVTVFAAEVTPTPVFANVSEVGVSVTTGAAALVTVN